MNTTEHNTTKLCLKSALMDRISGGEVEPRSRLFFQAKESLVWGLWLLSVVVGALAVAVLSYVWMHQQYELYEATHENFFTFFVEALPYVWVVTFGLMAYGAVFNLQHTKRGYRYAPAVILGSGVVLSLFGGMYLQWLGIGFVVDGMLGEYVPMYISQAKYERQLWQDPDDGRLLGVWKVGELQQIAGAFEDIAGQQWVFDISELRPREVDLLMTSDLVRVLGICTDKENNVFHVCGVFPWMMDEDMPMDHLMSEREFFVERMQGHGRRAPRADQPLPSLATTSDSVCASLRPVIRLAPVVQ